MFQILKTTFLFTVQEVLLFFLCLFLPPWSSSVCHDFSPSVHFAGPPLFLFRGSCNFQICAVIITHHYGSNRDMHVRNLRPSEATRGRRKGGEEEEENKHRERERYDSWGSASGWWVQKGQDLKLAVLFATACLLSLGNANQAIRCKPLPSLPPRKSNKKNEKRKSQKKFVFSFS